MAGVMAASLVFGACSGGEETVVAGGPDLSGSEAAVSPDQVDLVACDREEVADPWMFIRTVSPRFLVADQRAEFGPGEFVVPADTRELDQHLVSSADLAGSFDSDLRVVTMSGETMAQLAAESARGATVHVAVRASGSSPASISFRPDGQVVLVQVCASSNSGELADYLALQASEGTAPVETVESLMDKDQGPEAIAALQRREEDRYAAPDPLEIWLSTPWDERSLTGLGHRPMSPRMSDAHP